MLCLPVGAAFFFFARISLRSTGWKFMFYGTNISTAVRRLMGLRFSVGCLSLIALLLTVKRNQLISSLKVLICCEF